MARTASFWPVDPTRRSGRARRAAFTLVELLIVIGIIAVLLAMVIGIGSWATENAKKRDTRALLSLLDTALDEFRAETQGTLGRIRAFMDCYGGYPPDNPEAFWIQDGCLGPNVHIGAGGIPMTLADLPAGGQSDVVVMALAIRQHTVKAAQILERIDGRFRASAENFWDRDGDGTLTDVDEEYVYFIDAWGTPIEYYNLRDPSAVTGREELSTWLVAMNNGRPVLVSYGPNGKDQLSGDFGTMRLTTDRNDGTPAIDNRFNGDNIYNVEGFAEKLRGN